MWFLNIQTLQKSSWLKFRFFFLNSACSNSPPEATTVTSEIPCIYIFLIYLLPLGVGRGGKEEPGFFKIGKSILLKSVVFSLHITLLKASQALNDLYMYPISHAWVHTPHITLTAFLTHCSSSLLPPWPLCGFHIHQACSYPRATVFIIIFFFGLKFFFLSDICTTCFFAFFKALPKYHLLSKVLPNTPV